MADCKSCGGRILWAETPSGKAMPLDMLPSIKGNVAYDGKVARIVTPDANAIPMRYMAHFSSCPNAAQHRKARR